MSSIELVLHVLYLSFAPCISVNVYLLCIVEYKDMQKLIRFSNSLIFLFLLLCTSLLNFVNVIFRLLEIFKGVIQWFWQFLSRDCVMLNFQHFIENLLNTKYFRDLLKQSRMHFDFLFWISFPLKLVFFWSYTSMTFLQTQTLIKAQVTNSHCKLFLSLTSSTLYMMVNGG